MDRTVEGPSNILTVHFIGDLDMSRDVEITGALARAACDPRPVVIVLGPSVHYVDSFTLSKIVLFRNRLERQRRDVVVSVADHKVYRTLFLAGLIGRLRVFRDQDQAVASVRGAAASLEALLGRILVDPGLAGP